MAGAVAVFGLPSICTHQRTSMNGESSHPGNTVTFCVCGRCHRQWTVWREFILDPEVRLLGLQHVQNLPDGNLLVFDHSCGTSISILARQLRSFLPEPSESTKLNNCSLVGSITRSVSLVVLGYPCKPLPIEPESM